MNSQPYADVFQRFVNHVLSDYIDESINLSSHTKTLNHRNQKCLRVSIIHVEKPCGNFSQFADQWKFANLLKKMAVQMKNAKILQIAPYTIHNNRTSSMSFPDVVRQGPLLSFDGKFWGFSQYFEGFICKDLSIFLSVHWIKSSPNWVFAKMLKKEPVRFSSLKSGPPGWSSPRNQGLLWSCPSQKCT